MTQTFWQGGTFWNGISAVSSEISGRNGLVICISAAACRLLLFAKAETRRSQECCLALAVVHFLAYSALAVPPFHWYYVPEAAITILLGSLALGALHKASQQVPWQRRLAQAVIALAFLVPVIGMYQLLAADHFEVTEMPIHTNLATQDQYRQVGLWLKDNVGEKTVLVQGEIGALAYYCDCYLLNEFTDRSWLADGVRTVIAGHSPSAALYALNFMFLRDDPGFPPYSYLLTVRGRPAGNDLSPS